jgi:hypothetical protein
MSIVGIIIVIVAVVGGYLMEHGVLLERLFPGPWCLPDIALRRCFS